MNLEQLRILTLQSQGLLEDCFFGVGKSGILNTINQLGYLQIDSLSVVERAHHHILWSRMSSYNKEDFNDLVKEHKIFEYFYPVASYFPMDNYRFFLPRMSQMKAKEVDFETRKIMKYVLDRITAEGPKKSRDFKSDRIGKDSWGNRTPTKIALEKLFFQGDLMVCERRGFEKVYDIAERVLPTSVDRAMPSSFELAEYLVNQYLNAYSFTTVNQVAHLKRGKELKNNIEQVLEQLVEKKEVEKISLNDRKFVYLKSELSHKKIASDTNYVNILSPFDNAVIHRDRLEELFDFRYGLECYLPKAKRRYGYFTLPILLGSSFIGRMDCKAHRKEEILEIIHLTLEDDVKDDFWIIPFLDRVLEFAKFNGCERIKITKTTPSSLKDELIMRLNQ